MSYCRTSRMLMPSITARDAMSTPFGSTRSAVAKVKASLWKARLGL